MYLCAILLYAITAAVLYLAIARLSGESRLKLPHRLLLFGAILLIPGTGLRMLFELAARDQSIAVQMGIRGDSLFVWVLVLTIAQGIGFLTAVAGMLTLGLRVSRLTRHTAVLEAVAASMRAEAARRKADSSPAR